jgi:hypothetical protein
MTYAIIHSNPIILEKCLVKTINKHLHSNFLSLVDVLNDPDFCVIQKEEANSNIKIEQIKKLQKELIYSPFNRTFQFGIIKDAYLMTTEAQNALLKTLEECNENTIIILTINSESAVLETILSRCNRIYPNGQEIQEKSIDFSTIKEFLQKPIYEQVGDVEKIVKEKKVDEFLTDLTGFFRKEYTYNIENGEDNAGITQILNSLKQAKQRISKNVNTKIALEYICFQIDKNFKANHK